MSAKLVSAYFFTEAGAGQFTCNICGCERKQAPRSGFANLMSHLAAKHPTYQEDYNKFQRRLGLL